MLEQMMGILNNMAEDGNVKALKVLVKAMKQGSRIYMLRYKGKPVTFYINTHDADFSNGSTVYLDTDSTQPIWTTTDLITAVHAKYINTPWFNSSMETPTYLHKWDLQDVEVVDNFGKVYNRKLLKNKTIAILYSKIKKDNGLLSQLQDEKWANTYWHSLYDQQHILQEMKELYQKRLKGTRLISIKGMSLCDLYSYRKELVQEKCKKLTKGKSIKAIQKKLDSVNKKIIKLGGR